MNQKLEIGMRVRAKGYDNFVRTGTVVDDSVHIKFRPVGLYVLYDGMSKNTFHFPESLEVITPIEELALCTNSSIETE